MRDPGMPVGYRPPRLVNTHFSTQNMHMLNPGYCPGLAAVVAMASHNRFSEPARARLLFSNRKHGHQALFTHPIPFNIPVTEIGRNRQRSHSLRVPE